MYRRVKPANLCSLSNVYDKVILQRIYKIEITQRVDVTGAEIVEMIFVSSRSSDIKITMFPIAPKRNDKKQGLIQPWWLGGRVVD